MKMHVNLCFGNSLHLISMDFLLSFKWHFAEDDIDGRSSLTCSVHDVEVPGSLVVRNNWQNVLLEGMLWVSCSEIQLQYRS